MKYVALALLTGLTAACSQQPDPQTAAVSSAPAATADAPAQAAPTAAINTPRAKELLKQPSTVVLDVRTPVEYMTGHLEQAQNLNVNSDDFNQEIAKLDTSKTYVVYCHSGKRSSKAADLMYAKGFHHVVNGGGYSDVKP